MPNNVGQSSNSEGASWVARWMKPPHDNDNASLRNKSKEDAHGKREVTDNSKSDKGFQEVTETNGVKKWNCNAMNLNDWMEKNGLATSKSFGDFTGSTSSTKRGCLGKNPAVHPLKWVPEQISRSDSKLVEKNYQNLKTSDTSLLRKNDGSLFQNPSDIRFFPDQINLPQVERSTYSNYRRCVPQKVPYTVRDIETTKVRKIIESTQHMVITRKSDINLSEVGQIGRESALLNKTCADFGRHGLPGLKLRPLDGATGREWHGNMGASKTSKVDSKNKSPAETDFMDIELSMEKYKYTELALPVSNKDSVKGKNICSPQVKFYSNNWKTELPDINEYPFMDDGEPSTSRTHSLDMDHLFPNVDQRWVKRLKMSSPDLFSHGSKNLQLEIAPSEKGVNKFFEILKGSITDNTEPTSDTNHGTEQMVPLLESEKKSDEITLSHFWFRRWCPNQTLPPQKKSEVVCEPESSKTAFEDYQKEQVPSIGAMALMSKAMTGCRPYVSRRRGSLVIWNTKEL